LYVFVIENATQIRDLNKCIKKLDGN